MSFFKITAFVALAMAMASPAAAQTKISRPPLNKVAVPSQNYLNIRYLVIFWDEYCAADGPEELTKLLSPFKDFTRLGLDGFEKTMAERELADVFWKGNCIEPDRAFALSVYKGAAFRRGLDIFHNHFRSNDRPWGYSALYEENRLSANGPVPLLVKPTSAEAILPIDKNDYALADTMYSLTFFHLAEDIAPLNIEMNLLDQMVTSGPDGAIRAALSLRDGMFDLPDQNTLALQWLAYAQTYLRHPYAEHTMPLWLRDQQFRTLREAEGVPLDRTRELAISNAALIAATMRDETAQFPLIYCLLASKKAADITDKDRISMFALLSVIKRKGSPEASREYEEVKAKLSLLQYLSAQIGKTADKPALTVDQLPSYDVDVNSCSARMGLNSPTSLEQSLRH
jgi:hypothetical protein